MTAAAPQALPVVACDIAGCGQPIIWTRTATGKLMPVDAPPCPSGNVLVDPRQRDPDGRPYGGVLGAVAANAAHQAGRELRTHHRLSCTHPEQWARR